MMMWRLFLLVLALLVIFSMAGYAFYLLRKVKQQNERIKKKQTDRLQQLVESIEVIAQAMKQGQCELSEGVIRLKYLFDALGRFPLSDFTAMSSLYEVVAEMPILEARKQLKRNERMKQDLARENAEAEFEAEILPELDRLLQAVEQMKKEI